MNDIATQLKSRLLRLPLAYDAVQALRDRRHWHLALRTGSYAQHGEDNQLLALLKELGAHGPYVDVGCNHPFKLSNTYLLYRHGWRGVCIDPLPRFAPLYRRWRPEDQFSSVAIGLTPGEMPLYEFESDVLSTLDAGLAAEYQTQGYRLRRQTRVHVAPLNEILNQAGLRGPISLLSIDIEGMEVTALKSIDLERWKPALICLEALAANGQRNVEAIEYILARRYEVAADLGLNIVFRRRSTPLA